MTPKIPGTFPILKLNEEESLIQKWHNSEVCHEPLRDTEMQPSKFALFCQFHFTKLICAYSFP